MDHALSVIKSDRSRGALALALDSLDYLAEADSIEQIARRVEALALARKIFAPIGNLAREFQTRAIATKNFDRATAKGLADQIRSEIENRAAVRLKSFRARFDSIERLITLSRSSTIEPVLIEMKDRLKELIIAESRPLSEGLMLARALKENGARPKVILDSALGRYFDESTLLLLGADAIGADGSIVNKIGSYPAALCAHDKKGMTIVLADRLKLSESAPFDQGALDSERIELQEWRRHRLDDRADIFESVPSRLISSFLLEDEFIAPEKIGELFPSNGKDDGSQPD